MASLLVHLTQGPDRPTHATLAFLVARSALESGHSTTLFLAGDAVQLLRDAVLDHVCGVGTGQLREHYNVLVAKGARFHVSGASCKARGLTEADLAGKPVEMSSPTALVSLCFSHDRVITY